MKLVHTSRKRIFLFLNVIHVQFFTDSIFVIPVVFLGHQWVVYRAYPAFGPQNVICQFSVGLLLLHGQENWIPTQVSIWDISTIRSWRSLRHRWIGLFEISQALSWLESLKLLRLLLLSTWRLVVLGSRYWRWYHIISSVVCCRWIEKIRQLDSFISSSSG